MPHDPYRSLYIHIPFCVSRCNYCDFCTEAIEAGSPQMTEYTENVIAELRRWQKEGELEDIETVYVGGGTPTHLGSKDLTSLLYAIGITLNMQKVRELTVEANPESIDERLINDIWALGANRISIGVQSFDDDVLDVLGRAHSAKRAKEAVYAAANRFENISIDLMCGVPGQSIESFAASLDEALQLPVKHISIYPLSIESNTPFAAMMDRGQLQIPSEDEVADAMELASEVLERAGFVHYEVANYAKDSFESQHNKAYWTAKPYLGIGKSATTMTQNDERRMRVQDNMVTDDLDAAQMAAEDAMLGMRLICGISDDFVAERSELIPDLVPTLVHLEELGLVEHDCGRYRPTHKGWMCGNELYGALLETAPF